MEKETIKDALKNNPHPQMIGGQAVIEGVMMRGKTMYAMAVRNNKKEIELVEKEITPVTAKYPFLRWPILRGVVSFVDSLVTGMRIITLSAEMAGLEDDTDEPPGKFEQFLMDKLGEKLNDYLIYFAVVVAILLSVVIFMLLPVWIGSLFRGMLGGNTWALGIVEGFARIGIFLGYIFLVSQSKDIKRVFQYHGAEHKTINCFEHREELTVENVRKHGRLHKRCGTSFLLIVMVISMFVFLFLRTDTVWLRFVSRILLVPVIAGLSYEVIKWAGKNENTLVNIISYPGMCLQKITTAEPDDGQIEVAITAMKGVLAHEAAKG